MLKPEDTKGFTIVEILIVIMVISVLCSIAIVNFLSYRKRAYNVSAEGDARNAFIATQAYFNDHPDDNIASIVSLSQYGFLQTDNVEVTVAGSQQTLEISAFHDSGDRTYRLDSEGVFR